MKFKIEKLNFQIKLTIEKWTEPMSTVATYIRRKVFAQRLNKLGRFGVIWLQLENEGWHSVNIQYTCIQNFLSPFPFFIY